MSYHIYTTEGIILKRTPFGEANIMLHILTQDLGLIIASAQAVRLSVSKLRGALQEYSYISVSCVKGKNGWKVTNVLEKRNFYFEYPLHSHHIIAQINSVLLQMIPGEAPHPEIFLMVLSGFEFLGSISENDISYFEILMMLRILYELGYVVRNSETEVFLKETIEWNSDLLNKVRDNKKVFVEIINKALKESHL